MAWQITWRGQTWDESDLTVGHMAVIVQTQGTDSWEFINPFGGPMKLMGILAALIAVDEQRPANEVLGELALAPAWELLATLSTDDDDAPTSNLVTTFTTGGIINPDIGPDGGVAAVVPVPPAPKPTGLRKKVKV